MVVSEWLGSLTHDGVECNATSHSHLADHSHIHNVTADIEEEPAASNNTFVAGVCLSIVADAIIAVALCIQKYAHNNNKGADGQPIKSYLRIPTWWVGILLNIGGEVGNMLSYGLAPAAVVAPVGSVGVIVNEIIAVVFLKEPLRMRDVGGLILVITGVVLVIATVPEGQETLSVHHLLSNEIYFHPRAYWYLISILIGIIFFICYLEPRYAQERILVWLLLCSSISSCTVAACRGFASLVTLIPSECLAGVSSCHHGVIHPPCTQTIGHGLFWVLLGAIIVTAVWSAMYLNKAMMVYGNTEVVPVYYCTFTLASIVGGMMVYNELEGITPQAGVLFGAGVCLAFSGVGLLMSGHPPTQGAKKVPKTETSDVIGLPVDDGALAPGPPSTMLASPDGHAGGGGSSTSQASPTGVRPALHATPGSGSTAGVSVPNGSGGGSRPRLSSFLTPQINEVDVEVLSFRELELTAKVDALGHQPSSSQVVFGGSLVQATSDSLLNSGRDVALLAVESANYPGSLATARRLASRGRLAVGEAARAVFGVVERTAESAGGSAGTMLSPARGRVIPLEGPGSNGPAATELVLPQPDLGSSPTQLAQA